MFSKYYPQQFSQLIFEDTSVAKRLNKYASGTKTKSLLLYGQPGTAKSLTARLIANEASKSSQKQRLFQASDATVINGDDWNKKSETKIIQTWWHQSPYVVIDEVDELEKEQKSLTKIIDKWGEHGGLILTTNKHPNDLLERLVSRCEVIKIGGLSEQTVFPLVRQIFNDGGIGHRYTDADINTLIKGTQVSGLSSWRSIEDMVDDEIYYWLNK